MNQSRKSFMAAVIGSSLMVALLAGQASQAFGQTIPHWVDRQVHGTARHLTPRHHKPGTRYVVYHRTAHRTTKHHRHHRRSH